MKKLLLLTNIFFLSSTLVPNSLSNVISVNEMAVKEQNAEKIRLNVPAINQETEYYCVPATIQAIFAYFRMNISEQYTQTRIYRDLDGEIPDGLDFGDETANYIENNINSQTNNNVQYNFNDLGERFGRSREDVVTFQNYIHNSLSHNQPVLFSYDYPNGEGHAIVIIGIEVVSWAPWLTLFTYMEPTGGTIRTFYGRDLIRYTNNWSGIIGYGTLLDNSNKKEISVAIDNKEVGRNDLNDEYDHEVVKIRTDLTATMGINKTGELSDSISQIVLNDFIGEIYNFSWRKKIADFSFDVKNIPDSNDNWKSSRVVMASSSEDIGSAHIQGRISAQIEFERTKSLNHLLIYLVIYVSGLSWSTSNWAHVWLKTGDILSFIKK